MTKTFIKKIINIILNIISCIIPKTRKIVIVGGWFGERFADNSKAMYLFLFQNRKRLGLNKVIYVTRDKNIFQDLNSKGYSVLMNDSVISAWYHLRAKIHIVDQGAKDINRVYSIRATKINLWHGFALKKVNYMLEKGYKSLEDVILTCENNVAIANWNRAYYLAQSKEQGYQLQWMFGLREDRLIYGIYPRVTYLMGGIDKYYMNFEECVIEKLRHLKNKNKKIIFYLPTFRDSQECNDICVSILLELRDFLFQNDIFLITKLHYAANVSATYVEDTENIINLQQQSDVYNFIEFADIMITDYSSAYFDFMFLNRPIVFFPFDLANYQSNDRGFVYNYDEFIPGLKVLTVEELKSAILELVNNEEEYMNKYSDIYQWEKELVYEERTASIEEMDELWEKISEIR